MMEWYYGHEMDDLVLPKDQELYDYDLPSTTDTWYQFGGNGTSDDSCQQKSSSYGPPDLQYNEFTSAKTQMDDIFVNSLLKDEQPNGSEYNHQQQFCFSPPESQSKFMADDGDSTNMMLDFWCASSDTDGTGSSAYLENGGFNSSSGWDNGLELETQLFPSSEQVSVSRPMHAEESVLNQFETAMTQLNDKTRLCFRDSLYRLANSTKQQHRPTQGQSYSYSLNNPPPLASDYQMGRSESETNTIDRAVANLMFKKGDEDPQGHHVTMSTKSKRAPGGAPSTYNTSLEQDVHHSQPKTLKTESRDPIFNQSMVNQQHMTAFREFYSGNLVPSEPPGSSIRWNTHGN